MRERNVEIVFGEGTWGFELLTWLICRRFGVPMLTASTTRQPGDYFYFADAVTADLFAFASSMSGESFSARSYAASASS